MDRNSLYSGQDSTKSLATVADTSTMTRSSSFSGHSKKAQHEIATVDVTGAFLECPLKDEDLVIVEVSATVSKLLVESCPGYKEFLSKRGKLYLKLRKALFGCVQASMLWYEKLRSVLEKTGLRAHPYDKCYYIGRIRHQCAVPH